MFLLFLLSTLLIFVKSDNKTMEEDEVSSMPLYTGDSVGFQMYSGYLSAHSGEFFYYFTTSITNQGTDPVVLWLNGGPGCSSLMGAFVELGPFHPYNDSGNIKVEYNAYSWNNFANMLFLESPPCVGFSYPYSQNCTSFKTGDIQTAKDNYRALQSFFQKFPKFQNRSFYITGESYAGHYIPLLAQEIIEQNSNTSNIHINLKAVAIGNPYIQRDINWFQGWLPQMEAFSIISIDQYDSLLTGNCSNMSYTHQCSNQSWNIIGPQVDNINVYDVNVPYPCSRFTRQQDTLLRYIFQSNNFLTNLQEGNIWQYPYEACNEQNLVNYLNNKDVQDQLNVNRSKIFSNNGTWQVCSNWAGYNGTDDTRNMVPVIDYVLNNGVRVLIYSGLDDLVCAYFGSRYWIQYNLSSDSKGAQITGWEPWLINNQTAGWYQQWQNFAFLTVRDAGHEVPEYQPARAYSLFHRFLMNNYNYDNLTINDHSYESYGSSSSSTDKSKERAIGAGIAIGAIIAFTLLVGLVYWCWRKRHASDTYQPM